MTTRSIAALVERARLAAGLSQRALADETGISQSTLSRIIAGDQTAKMPEIIAIAWATGTTVAELTGTGTVADRVRCAARATNDSGMQQKAAGSQHIPDRGTMREICQRLRGLDGGQPPIGATRLLAAAVWCRSG